MDTICDMKNFLKSLGGMYCLQSKQKYIDRVHLIHKYKTFTWREDQRIVLDEFLKNSFQYYVINGIFGCGKTTLLLGMLVNSFIQHIFKPVDCMFISFNISIKNEIKRKLKLLGFSSKVTVTTFDSIIYKICKLYDYEYLDLPNFDGKRRFVYHICKQIETNEKELLIPIEHIRVIYIDEVQDLETQTFLVLKTFFKHAKIIFAGDVFQSIQKEPRESLLWHLLHTPILNTFKICMKETPRVPKKILSTLQTTLTQNYPEFKDEIKSWTSSNNISDVDVVWEKFYNYNQTFDYMNQFCQQYNQQDIMILSFSSAITVKGNMGDVARFRKFLQHQGYPLNNNHKKIDPDTLFLSTANSSKGLERDYVLCILTFPLELAFINFSNDIVLNLITVALTRAKKKVVFCVSAYKDKFSKVLDLFQHCPQPEKERIREGKTLSEYTFSDFMNIEHNVTSLIKQSVIKYDTRIKLKVPAKSYDTSKIFEQHLKRPSLLHEEDRALVGILIENLITSYWVGKWPSLSSLDAIKNNPMYIHCIARIKKLFDKYNHYSRQHSFQTSSIREQFTGILYYSVLYQAIFNKIFIHLHLPTQEQLFLYWKALQPLTQQFRPTGCNKINIQSNLRMPHLTGIADIIFTNEQQHINIWEIKASIDRKWKDDALTQAILYSLMTGKSWSRITLLNVFTNEKIFYHFNSKEIISLRNLVIQDILVYNCNCYLSKHFNVHNKKCFKYLDCFFIDITYHHHEITQISIIEFLSPTKCILILNQYFSYSQQNTSSRKEKLCFYSNVSSLSAHYYIHEFLSQYSHKTFFMMNTLDPGFFFKQHSIYDFIPEKSPIDYFGYEPQPQLKFQCDYHDAVVTNITKLCKLSTDYKLA